MVPEGCAGNSKHYKTGPMETVNNILWYNSWRSSQTWPRYPEGKQLTAEREGGGRHKNDFLASHKQDVLLLTEFELVEYAVKDSRLTFRDRGKALFLGASTRITKKDDKIRGRRVAGSIMQNIRPILPEIALDDGIDELRQ